MEETWLRPGGDCSTEYILPSLSPTFTTLSTLWDQFILKLSFWGWYIAVFLLMLTFVQVQAYTEGFFVVEYVIIAIIVVNIVNLIIDIVAIPMVSLESQYFQAAEVKQ